MIGILIKNNILKCLICFFVLSSCAHKKQVDKDYAHLLKQQSKLGGIHFPPSFFTEDFFIVQKDFELFKGQLKSILLEKYSQSFTKEERKHIKRVLSKKNVFSKKGQDYGSPVFHSFHGDWRGQWKENNKVNIYDHTWFPPEIKGDLVVQKVLIGQWNSKEKKRENEIAAINTYNLKTGEIFGAVDVDKTGKRTSAAHLGIYISPLEIIWIAKFTRGKTPYYSFYYEKIQNGKYLIRGLGFNWDSKKRILMNPHWKTGKYIKKN